MDAIPKIVIRRYGGSKAEQVQDFSIDQEISIGRDRSCVIRYEADEDLVSRKHARIAQDDQHPAQFLLTDLDSRNGTFVNKRRISGPEVLRPGDIVQLGAGGPELEFDIDPRPVGKTREHAAGTDGGATTRDIAYVLPGETTTKVLHGAPGSRTMQILNMARTEARRNMRYIVVAAAAVVILVGGLFAYQQNMISAEREARKEQVKKDFEALQRLQDRLAQAEKARKSQGEVEKTISPEEITKLYGPSTVLVETQWTLIDATTGQQLYHQYEGGGRKPVYVELPGGSVEPVLTTDPENNTNKPIQSSVNGSGLVVSEDGFILTSRHIAAPWYKDYKLPATPGYIYNLEECLEGKCRRRNIEKDELWRLSGWVPTKTKSVAKERIGDKAITGRHDFLDVTFLGSTLRNPARLVRPSTEHDVALIRIDLLEKVPLPTLGGGNGALLRPGSPVTVLGYPDVSPNITFGTPSQDVFGGGEEEAVVPTLTTTPGYIGRIIKGAGSRTLKDGAVRDYSGLGDMLQLTLGAVGTGCSGGPVFDSAGYVIGIFYARAEEGGGEGTFAVPIKYGLDLFKVREVF